MDIIKEKKIALEVCPFSNQVNIKFLLDFEEGRKKGEEGYV